VNTITCTNCGQQIEIDKALEGQIEARVLAAEHQKYEAELARVKLESEAAAKKAADAAAERAVKAAEADLDIARRRLEADMAASQKRAQAESELVLRSLREDAAAEKEQNARLRGQLGELMKSLREEKDARANAELAAQKRVAAEVDRAREEAAKGVEDKYHLKLAEQEKKLADTQKALEDAQRKAHAGVAAEPGRSVGAGSGGAATRRVSV
jgi:colicin import membrane protein